VAKEAFGDHDFPGFIQLAVGIQSRVLLLIMTAKTEGGAVRIGSAAQGGGARILFGAEDGEGMTGEAGDLAVVEGESGGDFGAHGARDGDIGGVAQVPGGAVMATAADLIIIPEMELGTQESVDSCLMAERAVLGLMMDIGSIRQVGEGRGNRDGFGRPAGWGRWPEKEKADPDPGVEQRHHPAEARRERGCRLERVMVWGGHRNVLAQDIIQFVTIRHLVGGAFVVILIPINRIKPVTDLAGQFRRPVAEKTVVGIPLQISSRPRTGIA